MRLILLYILFITSIVCGCKNKRSITLIKETTFNDFPSGSAIEFVDGKLYIVGDDAAHLLILDEDYNRKDSITLFEGNGRVPKYKKTDLEASTYIELGGLPHLLMIGSGSNANREKFLLIPLSDKDSIKDLQFDYKVFSKAGIRQVNIEGAAAHGKTLILANRANGSNKQNYLIVLAANDNGTNFTLQRIIVLNTPTNKGVIGLSGLAYQPEEDLLLFTASTEHTNNTTDDGQIGDSYIGIIENALQQITKNTIEARNLINLTEVDKRFMQQKIESVAIDKADKGGYVIHLVADNDNGTTRIFKCRLQL